MPATIISADDIKKELPGYDPEKAEQFHSSSAKLADKRFDQSLKSTPHQNVILMSGGPASGKTEFIAAYLKNEDVLIFDGILPSDQGADIKIKHITKAGKKIKVYAVWPEDFKEAYAAFLARDRKFSDEHFYNKHASARKTLFWIARNYPEIEIKLHISKYAEHFLGKPKLSFTEVRFEESIKLLEFLEENQYNPDDIVKITS